MRFLMLGSLAAGFVLVAGCADGTRIVDAAAGREKGAGTFRQGGRNILLLNSVLREPGRVFNSLVEVEGFISYTATIVPLDPIPPNPQYAVILEQESLARLRPWGQSVPVWTASGSSEDWIPIPDEGEAFWRRQFRVVGRTDGLLLNLQLRITTRSIDVDRMWLELAEMPAPSNDG